MRELIEKDREIIVVPNDFKNSNKGIITNVTPLDFTVKLKYPAEGFLKHNYCEFYTTTNHGQLSFTSYPKEINGDTLIIASPAKHKFLQRRQYRRIKFVNNLKIANDGMSLDITSLDISAGGMKFKTNDSISIDKDYTFSLTLDKDRIIDCMFSPIRIEKNSEEGYTVSGKFVYKNNVDKMTLIQYCAKRSIEIKNK